MWWLYIIHTSDQLGAKISWGALRGVRKQDRKLYKISIFVAKLIFNFNLEDEMASFPFSPSTQPDQKSSIETYHELQIT